MIAWWLRSCLVAGIAATVAIAMLLSAVAGLRPAAAAALSLVAVLAIAVGSIAVKYAISRVDAYVPPRSLAVPLWRAIAAALGEALAFCFVFGIVQPFVSWWMGSDAVGRLPPGRTVVLLVHGYVCNRGLWWWMRRRLRAHDLAVATIELEPPLGGIDGFADALDARIGALIAETGAERIAVVGHSMGGLVARACLRRHGSGRIAKLVTLATPHHGTRIALLGPGQNSREMEPDSAWLRALAAQEQRDVPVLSIWSARDELVVPQDSAHLDGGREVVLPALGHVSMVLSPAVAELIVKEVAEH
jgi:triacylglycerol lipase